MSRLEELIRELCPDGVEYKKLGEIATISRGGSFQKKDYVLEGVPCIHYGQIYVHYNLFVDKTISYIGEEIAQKQKFAEPNDVIMAVTSENIDDVCKCVAWLGNEKVAVSGHTAIIHHTINPKYLVYYLHSSMFYSQKTKLAHGTKVIEVKPADLENVVLPVPPMEVQREIVRILDMFTALTAELETELEAELEARRKQYEYYRDLLLTFDDADRIISRTEQNRTEQNRTEQNRTEQNRTEQNRTEQTSIAKLLLYVNGFVQMPLSEVADVFRGDYITKKATHEGTIPVILGGQEPAYYIDKSNHDGEIVVVARSGASAGFVSYWNEPIFVTDGFGYVAKPQIAITKYLFYVLKNMETDLNAMKRGAGVPHVSGEALGKVMLPIPSLDKQRRIVSILDRFDALCNDLTSGLPAEIAARQKQYEYYRDKLLSFEPLS